MIILLVNMLTNPKIETQYDSENPTKAFAIYISMLKSRKLPMLGVLRIGPCYIRNKTNITIK